MFDQLRKYIDMLDESLYEDAHFDEIFRAGQEAARNNYKKCSYEKGSREYRTWWAGWFSVKNPKR